MEDISQLLIEAELADALVVDEQKWKVTDL
jgi:hypothetical protein